MLLRHLDSAVWKLRKLKYADEIDWFPFIENVKKIQKNYKIKIVK